jgi:hypothetical protein
MTDTRTTLSRYLLFDLEDRLHVELGVEAVHLQATYTPYHSEVTCVGFDCDDVADVRALLQQIAAETGDPEIAQAATILSRPPHIAGMGDGFIMYWPDVRIPNSD